MTFEPAGEIIAAPVVDVAEGAGKHVLRGIVGEIVRAQDAGADPAHPALMTLDELVESGAVAGTAETLHQLEIGAIRHAAIMP